MDETWKVALAVLAAIFASNGFWAFLTSAFHIETAEKKLLKGLAHDRILFLCNHYVKRGNWITYEEYDNLYVYLFLPYKTCKGNGTAERAMTEVQNKLALVQNPPPDYKPC